MGVCTLGPRMHAHGHMHSACIAFAAPATGGTHDTTPSPPTRTRVQWCSETDMSMTDIYRTQNKFGHCTNLDTAQIRTQHKFGGNCN